MIEVLSKGGASVTFNADPYYVADRDWGGVTHGFSEYGGTGVDIASISAVDTSSLRRLKYVLDVVGTTQDDCLAHKNALLACLPNAALAETATFTVGATGSAYTGYFTVLGVEGIIEMPYDLRHDVGWVATVAFTLVCEPWVYGATDLLVAPSVIAPASPDGSTFPASWNKTQPASSVVDANSSKFRIATTNPATFARFTSPRVIVSASTAYQARCIMQVTAWTSGYAIVLVAWYDEDDVAISTSTIRVRTALDGAEVTTQADVTSPPTAVYARIIGEGEAGSTLTFTAREVKLGLILPELPCVLDFSDQYGDAASPFDLFLDADAAELSQLYLGHYPDTALVGDFITTLADAAWSDTSGTGAASADAAGYGVGGLEVPDGTPVGATFPDSWALSPSATYVHAAAGKFHVEADAGNPLAYAQLDEYIAVTALSYYTLGAIAEVLSRAGGTFYCRVLWYLDSVTYLSASNVCALSAVTAETPYSVRVQAPATATLCKVEGRWASASGACTATMYGWTMAADSCWGTEGSCYTDVSTAHLRPGTYRPLVKSKTADEADKGTIAHEFDDAVSIPFDHLSWVALPLVSLPPDAVMPGQDSTLRLTLTGAGAGDAASANAIAFLPCSFGGSIGWNESTVGEHAHTLRLKDGILYRTGLMGAVEVTETVDLAHHTGNPRITTRKGCLLAIGEQVAPQPTTATEMQITARPRYEQFPDSGGFPASGQLVFDGDSLSGTAVYKWPALLAARLPGWSVQNVAVAGQNTTEMLSDAVAQVDALYSAVLGTNLLFGWGGLNDLSGLEVGTYDRIVDYLIDRRGVGFKVVAFTLSSRQDSYSDASGAIWQTRRIAFNNLMRATWHTFADYFVDVAADPRLGGEYSADNTVYYADGAHFTNLGYQIVADIVYRALLGMSQ